ncbi:hypothetical protein ACGF0D_37580 [Kitasatospora sp. NPDC048298]|uniref:hypothetical protein n=1 Tax=Kitasatospora sp. NPDC048298 TaxID=3364049 RepID=UPI003710C193
MQAFYAEATGLVSVERSQFGLWEQDEFAEDGSWMDLPLCNETPGITLTDGAIKVRSTIRDHYAAVTLEITERPVSPEGLRLIARTPYKSLTGRTEAWTLFSGPTGLTLDFEGASRNFMLNVFWGSSLELGDQEKTELLHGVEQFRFAFEPAAG